MDLLDRVINSYSKLWEKPLLPGTPLPGFSERDMTDLCHRTVERLSKNNETLLELSSPIMVIGDIHGSIEDLLRIFRLFKPPPETRYLFLGDYVDRGDNSLEVMTILMALFCKFPDHVFLLRGNHEFSHINKLYGFYEEITDSYRKPTLWNIFQRVFSYLPLAAILNKETFCVHGGLSPYLKKVSSIRDIKLPVLNYNGQPLISDLMWSDPSDRFDEFSKSPRGSGVLFGKVAVKNFLTKNNLKFMVRAHQCTTTGVHAFAGTLGMTVFSCSDYCSLLANRSGAIQFKASGEVRFFSLGDDTEEGNCEKAIMLLVDGRMGLQRSTKSYVRNEPVTLNPTSSSANFRIVNISKSRSAVTLQGQAPPPLLSKSKSKKQFQASIPVPNSQQNLTHVINDENSQNVTEQTTKTKKKKSKSRKRKNQSKAKSKGSSPTASEGREDTMDGSLTITADTKN